MKPLAHKVALVTGGSRGIGRATVLSLVEAGAHVLFNYHRAEPAAESLCRQVRSSGGHILACQADVTSEQEVQHLVETATRELGPIQILVNNAGIIKDKTFLKMERAEWERVLQVNLDGVFHVTKAALPGMVNSGWGRIINVSSISGQTGSFGQTNYSASKGALLSFTKSLARELARKNITVNAVAPGFIETDMTKDLPAEVLDRVRSLTPVGRLGTAEEVAQAILFLASPQASYITGHILAVNGGMYM